MTPGKRRPAAGTKPPAPRPQGRLSRQGTPAPADPTPPAAERIQKVLARMGLGSRREIEGWITAGRLTVEGRVLAIGERLLPGQAVFLDGKPLYTETRIRIARTFILNKPAGTVCTRKDPEQRPTVFELFPGALSRQLVCVGRLDFNTAGLLIFTTDGELAHRLMHPRHGVLREYAVRVFGKVDDEVLLRLEAGVEVDGETLAFDDIERQAGQGTNEWYTCRLKTGRNREVRRLWESQGLTVSRLIRVRFGPLPLPRRLPAGRHVEVTGPELEALYKAVGLPGPAPATDAAKPVGPRKPRPSPAPTRDRRPRSR